MERLKTRPMRNTRAAACLVAMCGLIGQAAGFSECADSRCAQIRRIPPPQTHKGSHNARGQAYGCEAPPGWGWYRRQKLYHDCSQPLVVLDELGEAVSVNRNW